MARKSRAVPPLEPKRCCGCGGVMSERRPVYLVGDRSGRIVGPWHAGCAEKAYQTWQKEHGLPVTPLPPMIYGQMPPREETLPW